MENQMEKKMDKKMENEMETREYMGLFVVIVQV